MKPDEILLLTSNYDFFYCGDLSLSLPLRSIAVKSLPVRVSIDSREVHVDCNLLLLFCVIKTKKGTRVEVLIIQNVKEKHTGITGKLVSLKIIFFNRVCTGMSTVIKRYSVRLSIFTNLDK